MKLIPSSPKKAVKAFLKQKPARKQIDVFKTNLITLLNKIAIIEKQPKDESEEHLKNNIRDFLRDTYYKETNAINTKDKKDLVIHLNKTTASDVGVIIEAKRPTNKAEMITAEVPSKKAFYELILYYFNERAIGNNQLKQLVVTNIYEWYIIDANFFDKYIYRNPLIRKLHETKSNDKKDNPFFYEELSKIIAKVEANIPCVYFDIRRFERLLRNNKNEDDKELVALYKILSPEYLLKVAAANDSNALNAGFYKELLHIIGLEEAKENGKNIIRRKSNNRNDASLIELTIDELVTADVLHKVTDVNLYGEEIEEKAFNIGLELSITWINRILFLKLLEGQLVNYHQSDKGYKFLDPEIVSDFDELFTLFHKVLAVDIRDRKEFIQNKYWQVPYLNSSLFEISELEDITIKINSLGNADLELYNGSILAKQKKKSSSLPTLEYLLRFLDAYDFSSEGNEAVQEENKTIITASVLGKVFEKINGYKDGSIFTPAFVTMYMCRKSIRLAVVQKFNKALLGKEKKLFDKFEDLKNYTSRLFKTSDIKKANEIINSLRICDPAVGSGHFLVSALNEIIAIKSELGLLADAQGNALNGYEVDVINDELIITDHQGNPIEYMLQNGKPMPKVQHLQQTLFHEKQTIIENCLFGVDINSKSVLICRLRLWIELLKNAYYKEPHYKELETLPNIDINIKCGNSLLGRFPLDADLSKALKSIKYNVESYRGFVNDYKNEKNRETKRGLLQIIDTIKNDFQAEIFLNDPKRKRLIALTDELNNLLKQTQLFEEDNKQKKIKRAKVIKLEKEIEKLGKTLEEIRSNKIYKNAFEWRFEFPEILNNEGTFEGFDVIIGNPPYIQLQKLKEDIKLALERQQYDNFVKTGDMYQLFYELGVSLLKPEGQLCYITSNKWMRTDYGACTRKYLSEKCNTTLIIDFGMKQIFDSATTYTNILFLQNSRATDKIQMCRVKEEYGDNTLLEDYVDFAAIEMRNPGEKSWIAYDKMEYDLIQKIISKGKPLKEWDIRINRGILTGYNEAFIIDTKTRDRLVLEDPKSAEIIKPILRGEDIKPYVPAWAGLWVIGTFPALNLDIECFPAIMAYLSQFKERLTPKPKEYEDKKGRWKGRKSGSYKWFETQDSIGYFADFLKPKIIYPNMTKFLPFVYDKHQFFTNQKCFIITGSNLSYLTGLFNSKLFRFAFKEYFPELLGDTRELSKVFFETVAVKMVNEETNDQFNKWIDDIISLKDKGESASSIEMKIEIKLAEIYELTDAELKLILSSEGLTREASSSTSFISKLVNS